MLSEYAVEPTAIGADWNTFRYLIEKFGTDKGRLISRLPIKWEKRVIKAAKDAGVPNIKIHSMVERLHGAVHKVRDFNRSYDHDAIWIENAVREHEQKPFRAIISNYGATPCAEMVSPDDCSDDHPLFNAPISRDVARTAEDIATAIYLFGVVTDEIDIVDPYFNLRPAKGNYLDPLAALLGKLASAVPTPKVIRVHFRSHESRPPSEILARDAATHTKGLLPPGYCLELYEWSQVPGGEDLHDRFFLTEIGGLMIGAGLSAEGPAETATFTLLDIAHAQQLRSRFSATTTAYNKEGSIVRISADGTTQLL